MLLQALTGTNSDNLLVTIVVTLFVLSLISERLANFIKLNLQSTIERSKWLQKKFRDNKGHRRFNFRVPETDPNCEKLRERGIANIAILCGIFTAVLTGADLFLLIRTGGLLEYSTINLSDFKLQWSILGHVIGFIATGFFISLGSKFWHDLLDIVLYTSNLKRKLADPRTFEGNTADEIAEFINLTPRQLAEQAVDQFGPGLRQQPSVIDVTYGLRDVAGTVLEVLLIYVRHDGDVDVPATVNLKLASGRLIPISTQVIRVDGRPKVQFSIGNSIGREGSSFAGTFGCLLEGSDNLGRTGVFALTCSHVMTDRTAENMGGWLGNPIQKGLLNQAPAGEWVYGLRNRRLDIALIKLDNPADYSAGPFQNLKKMPRNVTKDDVNRLRIKIQGVLSQTTGFLVGLIEGDRELEYKGSNASLRGLLEIAKNPAPHVPVAISTDGDSGALIYDFEDNPVGLLVAGDSAHSYAIPFTAILSELKSLSIHV